MSYTALYRKLRPKTFKDVIGQEHLTRTLTNQIKANRIGHAYLFCGTRGTGKTSTAKIFAKAVNCMQPENGEPCNVCEICKSINEGRSMNIIEIDAASNNGVDNIRDIRDEVRYTPTEGKYKVYIIDEVHMLSIGAFNALLKTLEEPPSHVIFILATTEPHKIPITILSRCQRYDLKRIPVEVIANQLIVIMKAEEIEVEEKAINYIAKVADGSMRDALSILDQCIAFFLGQKLTLDKVLDLLGAVDTTIFIELIKAVGDRDVITCLKIIEDLIMQGRDLSQFVSDFTWFLRNLLIVKTMSEPETILDLSSETISIMKEQIGALEHESITRYIKIFSELANQMKYSSQKRILLEISIIKLCIPEMERSNEALVERIANLEKRIEQGMVVTKTVVNEQKKTNNIPIKKELPKAIPEDLKFVLDKWDVVVNQMPVSIKTYLKKTSLEMENEILVFKCENEVVKGFLDVEERKDELNKALEKIFNKEFNIKFRVEETTQFIDNNKNNVMEQLQNNIKFDITVEE